MRAIARYACVLVLAAALAGCEETRVIDVPVSTGDGPAASVSATASASAAATASPSAAASPSASASPTASASASSGGASLLGLLPVPANATPWPQNTGGLLGLNAFVQEFYQQSRWTYQEGALRRRGFVSAVYEGWFNPDGSQQEIAIIRFTSPKGALSQFDDRTATLRQAGTAADVLTDARDGSSGTVVPTPDSFGNTRADLVTHVGDYAIEVIDATPVSPDPAAAKALMLKQYQYFKQVHPAGS